MLTEDTLKKQEDIAKKAMSSLKEAEPKGAVKEEVKKTEEAKGVESKGATPAIEVKKTEEKPLPKEDAKEQADNDLKILAAEDKDLDAEGLKRKGELLEKSRKEIPEEDKIKKFQDNVQKRIDELVGQIKELKQTNQKESEEKEKLLRELRTLKTESAPKPSLDEIVEKVEGEKISKYLEEDKVKPREKRREMSKEELEEWLIEDYTSAVTWISDRAIRRAEDKKATISSYEHARKFDESFNRVIAKHPELDIKSREDELARKGLTEEEIRKTIYDENKKYRIVKQIIKDAPDEMRNNPLAPEILARKMEEILNNEENPIKKADKEKLSEEDEIRIRLEAAEAERQRQSEIDSAIVSTREKTRKNETSKSEFEIEQERLAAKVGLTPEDLEKARLRRKGIPGIAEYNHKEDE